MVVASVGFNRTEGWMYPNSEADFRSARNVTVANCCPTADRREAMGLDRDKEKLVELRARATGKVGLYRELPQIVVEDVRWNLLCVFTGDTIRPWYATPTLRVQNRASTRPPVTRRG